jgi:large subunit ribosomal protein L10
VKLEEKKKIIEDLREKLSRSKVLLVADYKGINGNAMTDLRRQLRETGTEFSVVKNTLFTRASDETDMAPLAEYFKGPNAIAMSYDDPVTPAKVLTAFAKDNKNLEIKVGFLNGKVLDLNAINNLSSLPSREELLATVLSAMNGVPTAFVRALNDVPCRMLNVLQAIKDQKEAA